MKRTKRITFLVNEVEDAQLTLLKEQFHGTRSGAIRYLLFADKPVQYVPQQQKRRLPSIPGGIKIDLNYVERDKFVTDNPTLMVDFSIEMKLKMKERRNKIDSYEEELLREVEIK